MLNKTNESDWWEEEIKKDPKLIRPFISSEFRDCYKQFLSVTDVFPFFSMDNFISYGNKNFPNISIFNYAIKLIRNHPFWYKQKFILIKGQNCFEEKVDVDYLKYNEMNKKLYRLFGNEYFCNGKILCPFMFKITQLLNNETQFTLFVSHCIFEARAMFTLFEYVKKVIDLIINKKENEIIKEDPPIDNLCEYDFDNFYMRPEKSTIEKYLKRIKEIPLKSIVSLDYEGKTIEDMFYIAEDYIFDYKPIRNFCKKYNVSIQPMLFTMMARAIRKFFKLSDETIIYNSTAIDTRKLKYTKGALRNYKFFIIHSTILMISAKKDNILDEIKFSYENLINDIENGDYLVRMFFEWQMFNKHTLENVPDNNIQFKPDRRTQLCTYCTNIGRINGKHPLVRQWWNEEDINEYRFNVNSYYTEEKFIITIFKPNYFNNEYMKIIEEEMDTIFNLKFI